MSDFRFNIEEYNGIAYLHVMIDPGEDIPGSPYLVSTHIPLDDIQKAIKHHEEQKHKVDVSVWEI